MPAFLLHLIVSVCRAIAALMGSPVGWCLAAFVAGWMISGHRVNAMWAAEKAAQKAAYQREVARQEAAAKEIAQAATQRVEEELAMQASLRDQIADLEREENRHDASAKPAKTPPCTPAVIRPCRVDDAFADRMRRLDDAAHRKAAPARPAR